MHIFSTNSNLLQVTDLCYCKTSQQRRQRFVDNLRRI